MRSRDFKFAELTPEKIEVRSSVGINIDPSSTAGVLRSRIEDDQSCVEFFLSIVLRVMQNKNLQTLTDDCSKGDDLIVAKNAKSVNLRTILLENRKNDCEKAVYEKENGLIVEFISQMCGTKSVMIEFGLFWCVRSSFKCVIGGIEPHKLVESRRSRYNRHVWQQVMPGEAKERHARYKYSIYLNLKSKNGGIVTGWQQEVMSSPIGGIVTGW